MRGHFYCGDVGGLPVVPEPGPEPNGLVGELGFVPGNPLFGVPVVPVLPGPLMALDPPPKTLTELNRSSTGS